MINKISLTTLGIGSLIVASNCTSPEKKPVRPNIILIMADDMGYEALGCNGGLSYKTPVLDRLASEGIRFTNCYSQSLCTPSRVKIMTGKYNFRNYDHFEYLNPNQKTFGNYFQEAGYATAIAGKWQLNGVSRGMPGNQDLTRPYHFGFDEYCLWQLHIRAVGKNRYEKERYANPLIYKNGDKIKGLEDSYGPDVFADFVIDFIERKADKPFFVYYPMNLPHTPHVPTPNCPEWQDRDKRYRQDDLFFKPMVEYLDEIVGRIEKKLMDEGLRENTLLLFTADNGTHRRIVSETIHGEVAGGKALSINTGNHVPLIAVWPSVIKEGRVYDGLISFADFLPTLTDIAGINSCCVRTDGKSFLSVLEGGDAPVQNEIFIHYTTKQWLEEEKWPHTRWVMDGQYKLYRDKNFFNTKSDPLENNPLRDLNSKEERIRNRFQTIINEKEEEFPFHWNNKPAIPEF